MANRPYRLTNLPVAALGVATAGLGAATLMMGNGDVVVERGFERALASMADRAGQAKGTDVVIAGGEQLRVSRAVHDAGVPVLKPVTVGDRITITSGGRERVLHVVAVDPLASSIVPTASKQRPAPLLLVTCRDDANPAGRPVRFLIEADETLPVLSSASAARTL